MRRRTRYVETFAKEYDLRLSTRTMNVLADLDLRSADSLATLPLSMIHGVQGAGPKTIDEIVTAKLMLAGKGFDVSEPKQLSFRAQYILGELGCESFEDLSGLPLSDVKAIPGAGNRVLEDIVSFQQSQQTKPAPIGWSKVERLFIYDFLTGNLSRKTEHILDELGIAGLDDYLAIDLEQLFASSGRNCSVYDEISLPLGTLRKLLLEHPETSADNAYDALSQTHASPGSV